MHFGVYLGAQRGSVFCRGRRRLQSYVQVEKLKSSSIENGEVQMVGVSNDEVHSVKMQEEGKIRPNEYWKTGEDLRPHFQPYHPSQKYYKKNIKFLFLWKQLIP